MPELKGTWEEREARYRGAFTDARWIKEVERKTVRWMDKQIRDGHDVSESDSKIAWQKLNANVRQENSQLELCRTGRCGRVSRLHVLTGQADG